jgi:hypothetical protein
MTASPLPTTVRVVCPECKGEWATIAAPRGWMSYDRQKCQCAGTGTLAATLAAGERERIVREAVKSAALAIIALLDRKAAASGENDG